MKYSEFKTKMKELELNADLIDSNGGYMLVQYNGDRVATVSKGDINTIDTNYRAWKELEVWEQRVLFDNLVALTSTPIKEREDEKKYNVVAFREKYGTKGAIKERKMFYYRNEDGYLNTAVSDFNAGPYQQWTLEQIKDWGLEDCPRIEVKEED